MGEWLAIAASLVLLAWFYFWTAAPHGIGTLSDPNQDSYYNLLARGLLKGELALDTPADPALAAMADPYDAVARGNHGLHDASYYKGKYYIYFGITPVLVLFLPYRVLTGGFLADHTAVMIFSFAGFLVAWAVLRSIVRAHFPGVPALVRLACLWVLGLGNLVPMLLRRPSMWEVPIACAYLFFMLALYAVWRALNSPARARWVVAASVAMGLGIGARPTYLAGAVVLLAPLAATLVAHGWCGWRRRETWTLALATVLPIAAIGAGLALYNYLRFENPLEFGQTYQMAGENVGKIQVFSPGYLGYNLYVYLLSPPGFSPYFPFLTVIDQPPGPPGHLGVENPYGLIPGMPWVLQAGVALGLAWRRRGALAWWCAGAAGAMALVLLTVACFAGNTGRYQVDFAPGLVLLGAIGAAGLASSVNGWARAVVAAGVAGLALWSVAFNFFVSLQHNRLLEINHPARYARLAHFFNHAPHAIARLTGHQDGPVELRVVFPLSEQNRIEPLVVTGHQFLADYVFVHYLEPGLVRFGLEHTSRGSWTGPATRIDPNAEHTVVVQMSSLYPPEEHPFYDGLAPEEKDRRTRAVRVALDGRTVLSTTVECYDASDWQPSIGASGPHRPGFKQDFTGRILGWRRLPPLAAEASESVTGRLHLLLRLPPFTHERSEPLLSTGETGKGDLVFIRYLSATQFQIGHDRWGYGGTTGPVVTYDPEVPVDLDISCPPLFGDGAPPRFVVAMNGTPFLDIEEAFHPSRATQVAVGRNLIGASTAAMEFTGTIEVQERIPAPPGR